MGLQSLPVAFGVETAKWITVGTIDVTQIAVAAYLAFGLKEPIYAGVLFALVLPQVLALFFQKVSIIKSHSSIYGASGAQLMVLSVCPAR
jgi:hypothetical protein